MFIQCTIYVTNLLFNLWLVTYLALISYICHTSTWSDGGNHGEGNDEPAKNKGSIPTYLTKLSLFVAITVTVI